MSGCAAERILPRSDSEPSRPTCERAPRYRAPAAEAQQELKTLGGRIAQDALTYSRRRVASCARVVYPQSSGITPTSAGFMVAVEQIVVAGDKPVRLVTRVVDVRLSLIGGAWKLERIGSLGGSPPAGGEPSAAARRVLDHPDIELTDSARWDVRRGVVDEALLATLADAADRRPLSVLVFSSGHPPNVWGTDRLSAHTAGKAADIWAVDGRPVIEQRAVGSPAHTLASELLAGGAAQVGSPWVLGGRSFSDAVHQDHIHIQQR